MRVISGSCRGTKLLAPAGNNTRPTSDRVKESLFSMLACRVDFSNIRVLDICAGTGSLGIEALSRGAGYCCFIECNKSVVSILQQNLNVTSCLAKADLKMMDALKALHILAERKHQFDLVFFDPPYDSGLYHKVISALDSLAILSPASVVVAECSVRNPLPESFGRLTRFDRRLYGETAVELFALEE